MESTEQFPIILDDRTYEEKKNDPTSIIMNTNESDADTDYKLDDDTICALELLSKTDPEVCKLLSEYQRREFMLDFVANYKNPIILHNPFLTNNQIILPQLYEE